MSHMLRDDRIAAEPEVDEWNDISDRAVIGHRAPDADASTTPPQYAERRSLAARLQDRHPDATPAMVQRSIDDSIAAFSASRVTIFLPILIERAASASLSTLVETISDASEARPQTDRRPL